MRTFENGVLRNEQQPGPVNSFIDQGEFVAMKTLSGRKAPLCDKKRFRDKIMVSSYLNDIVVELGSLNVEKIATFASTPFCVRLSSAWLLGTCTTFPDHKGTQRERLGAYLNKFLAYFWGSYTAFALK